MTHLLPRSAVGLGLLAAASAAVGATCVKAMGSRVPALEIVGLRCIVALPFLLYMVRRQIARLDIRRPHAMLGRGLIVLAGASCYMGALQSGALAQVEMIRMAKPLVVAAMAALFLRERLPRGAVLAILTSCIGLGLIADVGGASLGVATALALAATVLQALGNVTARSLSADDQPLTIVTYMFAVGAVGGILFSLPIFVVPTIREFALVALSAVFFLGAHLAATLAYRRDSAGVVSATTSTQAIHAVIIGFFFWGELPSATTTVGAAVVLASVLWLGRARRGRQVHARRLKEKRAELAPAKPAEVLSR